MQMLGQTCPEYQAVITVALRGGWMWNETGMASTCRNVMQISAIAPELLVWTLFRGSQVSTTSVITERGTRLPRTRVSTQKSQLSAHTL